MAPTARRDHHLHAGAKITAPPQNHTAPRMARRAVATRGDVAGAAAAERNSGRENGWLVASMTSVMSGWRMVEDGRQPNSRPMATSAANGMRNFTDAASQTQDRTCARLFLNASVTAPATARTSVDCHR